MCAVLSQLFCCWCCVVQYNFTVVDKSCGSCPALVFTSSSPTVPLTGLTPNTTVSLRRVRRACSGLVAGVPAGLLCYQAGIDCPLIVVY
jgi:hypothetical protein